MACFQKVFHHLGNGELVTLYAFAVTDLLQHFLQNYDSENDICLGNLGKFEYFANDWCSRSVHVHSESLILINAQHLSISQGHLLIFEMPFKIVQSIYMQFISLHIFQNAQCKDVIIWHSPNLYLATSLYNRGHTFYLNNLFKFEFCTRTARLRGQFTTRPSLSFLHFSSWRRWWYGG